MGEKTVDLSLPVKEDLHFEFIRDSGKSSAIIRIIKPEGVKYTYQGTPISYLRVSRSDLSTSFTKIVSNRIVTKSDLVDLSTNSEGLEYTCSGQTFTDLVDEQKRERDIEIGKYRPSS